jgi:hypothetical protein
MTTALVAERPADLVDDYHGIGLRLWHGKVGQHGPLHRCLICGDVRRYLGWPPLPIVIGQRVFQPTGENAGAVARRQWHQRRCEP